MRYKLIALVILASAGVAVPWEAQQADAWLYSTYSFYVQGTGTERQRTGAYPCYAGSQYGPETCTSTISRTVGFSVTNTFGMKVSDISATVGWSYTQSTSYSTSNGFTAAKGKCYKHQMYLDRPYKWGPIYRTDYGAAYVDPATGKWVTPTQRVLAGYATVYKGQGVVGATQTPVATSNCW